MPRLTRRTSRTLSESSAGGGASESEGDTLVLSRQSTEAEEPAATPLRRSRRRTVSGSSSTGEPASASAPTPRSSRRGRPRRPSTIAEEEDARAETAAPMAEEEEGEEEGEEVVAAPVQRHSTASSVDDGLADAARVAALSRELLAGLQRELEAAAGDHQQEEDEEDEEDEEGEGEDERMLPAQMPSDALSSALECPKRASGSIPIIRRKKQRNDAHAMGTDQWEDKALDIHALEKTQEAPRLHITKFQKQLAHKHAKKAKDTAGPQWFNMPATTLTPELSRHLRLLKMRNVLDPKRHYKANDSNKLPKYFQVATMVDDPLDGASRVSKKHRKKNLAEQLLEDVEFRRYNKTKYNEIQKVRSMKTRKGMAKTFRKKQQRKSRAKAGKAAGK